MHLKGKRRASAFLVLLAVLLLSACGGGGSADGTKVQNELKTQLADLNFTQVTCPKSPPLKKGATFQCNAVSKNGAHTLISVSQPEQAKKMKFDIARNEMVQVSAARDFLQKQLTSAGATATVDCGSSVRIPVDEGTTLVCRATDNGSAKTANYTIVAHPTADDVNVTIK